MNRCIFELKLTLRKEGETWVAESFEYPNFVADGASAKAAAQGFCWLLAEAHEAYIRLSPPEPLDNSE